LALVVVVVAFCGSRLLSEEPGAFIDFDFSAGDLENFCTVCKTGHVKIRTSENNPDFHILRYEYRWKADVLLFPSM
jgi:hypothetical protein